MDHVIELFPKEQPSGRVPQQSMVETEPSGSDWDWPLALILLVTLFVTVVWVANLALLFLNALCYGLTGHLLWTPVHV